MNVSLFILSLAVAALGLWLHGWYTGRRQPPTIIRRQGEFTDPDLWRALH